MTDYDALGSLLSRSNPVREADLAAALPPGTVQAIDVRARHMSRRPVPATRGLTRRRWMWAGLVAVPLVIGGSATAKEAVRTHTGIVETVPNEGGTGEMLRTDGIDFVQAAQALAVGIPFPAETDLSAAISHERQDDSSASTQVVRSDLAHYALCRWERVWLGAPVQTTEHQHAAETIADVVRWRELMYVDSGSTTTSGEPNDILWWVPKVATAVGSEDRATVERFSTGC